MLAGWTLWNLGLAASASLFLHAMAHERIFVLIAGVGVVALEAATGATAFLSAALRTDLTRNADES